MKFNSSSESICTSFFRQINKITLCSIGTKRHIYNSSIGWPEANSYSNRSSSGRDTQILRNENRM